MARKRLLPDIYTFVVAAIAGLIVGGLFAYVFHRFNISGTLPLTHSIGGYPIGVIMTDVFILIAIALLVFFGYISAVVRDTTFPNEHPWLFLIETLFVAFVPASIVYVSSEVRTSGRVDFTKVNQEFFLLAAKFAIFHLLFQFSGFYTFFFARESA